MLLAASCVHAPSRDQAGPLASAQRLLAREFGAGVTSSRLARLSELPGTMTDELTRVSRWQHGGRDWTSELRRPSGVATGLRDAAGAELSRAPSLERAWPNLRALEQDMANDLDLVTKLIGTSLHPLGEISDREHRTDPNDQRPEQTFWQRLRRRLRL